MSIVSMGISPILSYCESHSHNLWEIVLNLEGEGHMVIGDKEYPYKPGTIICQPPHVPHIKYCKGKFRDIYIIPSNFTLPTTGLNESIVIQDDSEKSFENLFLITNRIFQKKENNYMEITNYLYDAIEQLLLSWYISMPENTEIERLKNKFVNSFSDSDFSICNLFSEGYYCTNHLRRLFKQATGLTPIDYLMELRLNYAKKLLRENDKLHYTIAEISTASGFDDPNYFSRIFKKKTGKNPSEYIREADSFRN